MKVTLYNFKTFNQLNFFPAKAADLCFMENVKNIEETILTYTSAWNETEHDAILAKIKKCWSPEGTYTDKITDTITGQDAITNLIISSYGQMGPRTFKVLGEPNTHHQSGRFRWLAIRPEGYPVEGMDYFEFDEQYRITKIVGFF
ncbi:isomerase [Mucilaginibacter sp. CAU 1740]|uniref:isomerase n=1 Tax=Mucilaginibacter sp. CAU 1740 TaxID=3140365 RepID=UPI00325A5368